MKVAGIVRLLVAAVLFILVGCSSQDFGRPVGRYGDVVDSGNPYTRDNSDEEAALRAQRLAGVLSAWEAQRLDMDKDYTIGSDDVLEFGILALEKPDETSTFTRTVSQDGSIELPLVGTVFAAGGSTRELTERLVEVYEGGFLKNPQITIKVLEYRSAPVVVTGMVGKPGVYYLQHNQSTVLEILSMAGGLAPRAGGNLHIIRPPASTTNLQETVSGSQGTELKESAVTGQQVAVAVLPGEDLPDEKDARASSSSDLPAADEECEEIMGDTATWITVYTEPLAGESNISEVMGSTSTWVTVTNPLAGMLAQLPPDEDVAEESAPAEGKPDSDVTEAETKVTELASAAVSGSESGGDVLVVEKPRIITVDLEDLLDRGDVRLNLPIYGNDIISVPPGELDYVYVLGYVQRPGSFELKGKKEVEALQAVAMAGGLTAAARGQNTVLIRESEMGREVVGVDLTKIARGSRPPLYMQPGDTLIVGSGFFAKLAEFIKPSVGASASVTPGL